MKNREKIIGFVWLMLVFFVMYGLLSVTKNATAAYFDNGNYNLTFNNISSVTTSLSNLSQNITYEINITNNDNQGRIYNISANSSGNARVWVNGSDVHQVYLGNLSDENRSALIRITINTSSAERVNITIFAKLHSDSSVMLNSSGEINLTSTFDNVSPNIKICSPRNTTYYLNYSGSNQSIYVNASAFDGLIGVDKIWFNNGTENITIESVLSFNLTNGSYNWSIYANDSLGNLVNQTVFFNVQNIPQNYSIINLTYTVLNPEVNVSILPFEYNNLSRVDSNNTLTDQGYLDLSQRVNSDGNASLSVQNLTLNRISNGVNFTIEFLDNTILSGGTGWTGKDFAIPSNLSLSGVSAPGHTGHSEAMRMLVKVGSGQEINLSRPARIVLPGMASRLPTWGPSTGALNKITTNCTSDGNYSNIYYNISPRECRATNGSDMIIWTYHLSYFGAYNITEDPASDSGDDEESTDSASEEEEEEFWINTTTKTSKDLSEFGEINVTLKAKYQVSFKVSKKIRYLGVVSVSPTSAKINVTSSDKPYQYPFAPGESRKMELTGDNYYDVEVKVTSIKGVNVNVTISYVHLVVNESKTSSSLTGSSIRNASGTNSSVLGEEEEEGESVWPGIWKVVKVVLIVLGIMIVLGAGGGGGYLYLRHFYKERNLSSKVKVKSQDDD